MNAISARRHLAPEQPDPDPARVLRDRGAVERAEWADPADTNERSAKPWQVSGWRRSDAVLRLFPPRSRERDAAERLRKDCDIAQGLRSAEPDGARGGGFATPTDAMLDATRRVRRACAALTPAEVDIVSWAVVQGASLADYERRLRLRHGTAEGRFRFALLALADHYDLRSRVGMRALRA